MKKGFTLLELLISIGIVAILVAAATVTYGNSNKQARDSKRRIDIQAMAHSVDQYFLENRQYPTGSCDGINVYLETQILPVDPLASQDSSYAYDLTNSCDAANDHYCVCARMEMVGSGNAAGRTNGSCTWGGNKDYFCVASQQ